MGIGKDSVTVPQAGWTSSPGLRKLHRYNAIILSGFILAHFANHLSGFWGIDTYNAVQSGLRQIYRVPPVEWALLLALSAQIGLGTMLLFDRLRSKGVSGFWGWLQVISGGVFLVFMIQHLYSLGMARLYFSLDTNFYWPASVMSGPWFIYYFAPYYFLGVFALFAHIGAGVRFAMIERGARPAGHRAGLAIIAIGFVVAIAIPPIISGAFFPITLPGEWIEYLRFYSPGFEPW